MPQDPNKPEEKPIQKQPPDEKTPPVQKPQADTKPISEPKKEKPKVKQSKDESLKFTMTYANGGFNNGVELKPGKDGKVELSITIYGGGEKKSLGISGLSPEIEKLVRAYEVGATSQQDTPEIVTGLKDYFNRVNQVLSMKIMTILQEADNQIKESIKETFKQVK